MHKVAVLSLLLVTLLAGCTDDDDVAPATDPQPADGTYIGPTLRHYIGQFTWGDNDQGPGVARVTGIVATVDLPHNVTQLELRAERTHNGVEREPAYLIVAPANGSEASAVFPLATAPPQAVATASDVEVTTLASGSRIVTIAYEYDAQPPGVTHHLRAELWGTFPIGH